MGNGLGNDTGTNAGEGTDPEDDGHNHAETGHVFSLPIGGQLDSLVEFRAPDATPDEQIPLARELIGTQRFEVLEDLGRIVETEGDTTLVDVAIELIEQGLPHGVVLQYYARFLTSESEVLREAACSGLDRFVATALKEGAQTATVGIAPKVTQQLVTFLETTEDHGPRHQVASVLGVIGATEAIPAIRSALSSTDDGPLRVSYLEALADLGDEETVLPEAIQLTKDPAPKQRIAGLVLLGNLGGEAALKSIEPLLSDPDSEVAEDAHHSDVQIREGRDSPMFRLRRID